MSPSVLPREGIVEVKIAQSHHLPKEDVMSPVTQTRDNAIDNIGKGATTGSNSGSIQYRRINPRAMKHEENLNAKWWRETKNLLSVTHDQRRRCLEKKDGAKR